MKVRNENTELYRADPTVVPLHATQQLSLIKSDFRYFLSIGVKVLFVFENLSFFMIGLMHRQCVELLNGSKATQIYRPTEDAEL